MARSTRATWARRVEQWVESGAGGAEFAARLGVKESTLRHWKWQLGQERRLSSGAQFIEVKPAVSAQLVSASAFELVLGGDRRLRIPASFDEAALRRLLNVLEGECTRSTVPVQRAPSVERTRSTSTVG